MSLPLPRCFKASCARQGVRFGRPRLVSAKLQTEAMALKESGIAMPEIAHRAKLGRFDDLSIAGGTMPKR